MRECAQTSVPMIFDGDGEAQDNGDNDGSSYVNIPTSDLLGETTRRENASLWRAMDQVQRTW